ncbi:TlpA disulfide reductase family protein [Pedobacter sp. MC2016-24]|uniref:TlpA family protein disulfide reductase n=1 Tax=Pedobacter sp. MC2016-24 TaxID=2780090 RepID=UPI00188035EE|nr:TlpA disulfide reductase family protein [Pedobacter sp. MC2016-24]MBE9597748.1 TlpA family protein disulfide reductase [Pedobacter sp. MC2016-24]
MKKTVILLSIMISFCYCSAQSIDTAALGILQKSYDRLVRINPINYRMTKLDTMIRDGWPRVVRSEVNGTISKNGDWLIYFEDLSVWLVRNDTLYKKKSPQATTTYTDKWNSHDLAAFSPYNILGKERPLLNKDDDSIRFVSGSEKEKFYIIDIIRKKIDYGTPDLISKQYYNRYWIDKKNLLPVRRLMHSKKLESGKEAVDIYDFSLSIPTSDTEASAASAFLSGPVEKELDKNKYETLKIGSLAPKFSAVNVRNGRSVSHEVLKGKVVLLDFWYLSCMPCKMLIPKIQRLRDKFKSEDVAIVGINVRDTSAKEIRKFLKERKILFSQYYMAESMMADYKLYAFPTTMIVGRDGQVKLVEIGEGEDTEQKLEQAIRKELKLKPGF